MLRFRLHHTPTRALPLNVRSAGHYRFVAHQTEDRAPGDFLQVFWSVAGVGRAVLGGVAHVIRPGTVFYHAAGEPHALRAEAEGWEYRWLTFDGPRFARIASRHGLARVQVAGPCPAGLFEELDACLQDLAPEAELRASVLAYEILLRAAAPRSEPAGESADAGKAAEAKAWLDAHFTDARLNVAALAARFGLHRATLHRVFMRHYGVPPVRHLGRLRLRLALQLLANPTLPVADVAVRCGLPDVSHFSKLISRHTGYGPRAYRRRHVRSVGGA